MGWTTAFRTFFIIYCVEAGVFLLLSPWSPRWDEAIVQISNLGLRELLFDPAVRGAISGFGLVHLLWGAHDLDLWLASRKRAAVDRLSADLSIDAEG